MVCSLTNVPELLGFWGFFAHLQFYDTAYKNVFKVLIRFNYGCNHFQNLDFYDSLNLNKQMFKLFSYYFDFIHIFNGYSYVLVFSEQIWAHLGLNSAHIIFCKAHLILAGRSFLLGKFIKVGMKFLKKSSSWLISSKLNHT